jgi:hypothetical protein
MPEAFKKALDVPSENLAPKKPVIIDAKVDVPGLGPVDVAYEPRVTLKDGRKKESRRKEFFKRIAGRPIRGEFNGMNRAARREPVNQLNNYGNPKGMGKSRRNKKGDIIRGFGGGTPGARSVCGFRTRYAECEKGLTPADLRRKAEQISRASKTRKAPTVKRAKKAAESLS